ncbi:hypothetical protein CHS0354_019914 [Potamilus streckersoni]|uniref:Uncharacterized protein n=1 Tax=Potamilus streckersoni TaxID=2493646 RepID=A0AAE0SNL0_9BIVA|nr:hypothetical protein CHS0354_019914 [Potamilus streckersoni]
MDQKLLFFIICYLYVGGTSAAVSGKGFWEIDPEDQFLLIFNYLEGDKNLTLKLLKIADASRSLLSGGKENASAPNPDSPAVYFVLDKFAELLRNRDFLDIAAIIEDEVSKVNTSRIPPDHPDLLMKYTLAKTNYLMILHRVLGRKSIRTILPNLPKGKVNEQCYSDTMDYLDALNYPMKWAIDSKYCNTIYVVAIAFYYNCLLACLASKLNAYLLDNLATRRIYLSTCLPSYQAVLPVY